MLPVVFVGVSFAAGLKLLVIELVFVVELDIGVDIVLEMELDDAPAPLDALGAVEICPTDGGIEDCWACAAEIVGAANSTSAHAFKRIELNWLRLLARAPATLRLIFIGRVSTSGSFTW